MEMKTSKRGSGLTSFKAMDEACAGGTDSPSSSGKAGVPFGWISTRTPASAARAGTYSPCWMYSSNVRPAGHREHTSSGLQDTENIHRQACRTQKTYIVRPAGHREHTSSGLQDTENIHRQACRTQRTYIVRPAGHREHTSSGLQDTENIHRQACRTQRTYIVRPAGHETTSSGLQNMETTSSDLQDMKPTSSDLQDTENIRRQTIRTRRTCIDRPAKHEEHTSSDQQDKENRHHQACRTRRTFIVRPAGHENIHCQACRT